MLKKVTYKGAHGVTLVEYFSETGEQIDQDIEIPGVLHALLEDNSLFDGIMHWIFETAKAGTVTTEEVQE